MVRRHNTIDISRLAKVLSTSRSAIEQSLVRLSGGKGVGGIRNNTALGGRRFVSRRRGIDTGGTRRSSRGHGVTGCYTTRVRNSSFICLSTNAAALCVVSCVSSNYATDFIAGNVDRTGGVYHGKLGICILNNGLGRAARTVIKLVTTHDVRGFGFAGTFLNTGNISLSDNFAAPSARRTFIGTTTVRGSFISCILTSTSGFKGASSIHFTAMSATYVVASGRPSGTCGGGAIVGIISWVGSRTVGVVCAMAFGPTLSCIVGIRGLHFSSVGHACNRRLDCNNGKVGISILLSELKGRDITLNFGTNFANRGLRRVLRTSKVHAEFVGLGRNGAEVGIGIHSRARLSVGTNNPPMDRGRITTLVSVVRALNNNSILILTNDIPKALPTSVCRGVLSVASGGNIRTIISTANSLLLGILGCGPFLVGPGGFRLNSLFKMAIEGRRRVVRCTGGLREVNTHGILISENGSNTVLITRGKRVGSVKVVPNGPLGSINYNSSVITNFITNCVSGGSCSCTLGLNSTYSGTATFDCALTSSGNVRSTFGGLWWFEERGL